jgi:hypothetical protein
MDGQQQMTDATNVMKGLQETGTAKKIGMETRQRQGSGQEEWPDVERRVDVRKYVKPYMSCVDCY